MVTPFSADGTKVDWGAYEKHVERQILGGVQGLVPCGTTGETPTLSDAEQREIVQRTAALARGRAVVIAGTGSNSTQKTIESSRAAIEAGADGVMIVMPYYSKPSQSGLERHLDATAKAVDAPVILYNIPGRTGVELHLDTLARLLSRHPNIVALKDATNNVQYCQSAVARFGDRLTVLSGDDALTVPMMSVGAQGVISVTSNLLPEAVSATVADMLEGRWVSARARHLALLPVHAAMFVEPNPAPVKAALASRALMNPSVRLPLVEATAESLRIIQTAIETYEVT